jgi:hypothetical protein
MISIAARAALLLALLACGGCRRHQPGSAAAGGADTGFAAMQARGRSAMGVDQSTSSHVFEPLPDGGRIVLRRDTPDSAGTATIRAHMAVIAAAFARGDFTLPEFVHGETVPGTAVMAARRAGIRYVADTVPRGGEVRILTRDTAALRAVHAFLAYQRAAHHAGMHMPAE